MDLNVEYCLDLSRYCRLCLENSCEEMHPIFPSLNNKIIIMSGLDLNPVSEVLPKKVKKH